MKVLYLSRGGNPHDRRFLDALGRTNHVVTFLPLESSAGAEQMMVAEGIEVLDWRCRSDGRSVALEAHELKLILDQIQPEVIHAGPILSGAYLAAKAGGHPLLSMSWGSDLLLEALDGEGRTKAEYALQRSDVLVCDCETVLRAAVDLGISRERIVVFPWGVDLGRFAPAEELQLRQDLGWEQAFILLSTRHWEPIYGIDVIVEAFTRAARQVPELRLMMLGEGSQREELLGKVSEAGFSDHIHAPGTIDGKALPSYYRSASIYVSASHSDGTSISLLEAMACGLPAVVSDIPGNREWVVPEKTGWWFEDGNAEALSYKMVEAASSEGELAKMGRRSREIAEERGDWTVNFEKLLDAYEMAAAMIRID